MSFEPWARSSGKIDSRRLHHATVGSPKSFSSKLTADS
jgi:hypothetical protein